MSGGVDSSAAALLLMEEGAELLGVTLRLFAPHALAPQAQALCQSEKDIRDASAVAAQLGFPHQVLDASADFARCVMDDFAQAYCQGRTPNPCVTCNRTIKFGALLQQARHLGCSALATGHYARTARDPASGRTLLYKARCAEKDQSYVLSMLTQAQLAHSRFPLGEHSKEEIRAIAAARGLASAHRSDSQDICFVPDGDYAAFIRRHTGRDFRPGDFVDRDGQVLGRHQGVACYTVGQRRGLGVSSSQGRLYVQAVRPAENQVVLGPNQALFRRTLTANALNLIAADSLEHPTRLRAKIRYRQAEQPCTVEQTGPDTVRAVFDTPQRAITPGQTVVFYQDDLVVGGAVILPEEEESP